MSSVRRPSLRRRLANPKAADARTGATRPALAFTSSRIIHFRSALNHALLPPLRASTLRQPGFVRYLSPNVTHPDAHVIRIGSYASAEPTSRLRRPNSLFYSSWEARGLIAF